MATKVQTKTNFRTVILPVLQRKSALDVSLQEAAEGKVTYYKNVKDIFK
jgi:hypothetical protein